MPFCPKCKTEYPKETTNCLICGSKLAAKRDNGEAFLISVNEGFPAKMIEGSLRTANIPFVKKGHSGSEGFARFDTKYDSLGADFYVPSPLLQKAKAALPPVDGANKDGTPFEADDVSDEDSGSTDEIDDTTLSDIQGGDQPETGRLKRIYGTIFFLILMALVIFGVDFVMNIIRSLLGYK